MSRRIVIAIFAVLAAGALVAGAEAIVRAAGDPTARTIAFAAHRSLKATVLAAFAVFVAMRPPARNPSREPIAFVACAAALLAVAGLRAPGADTGAGFVVAGDALAALACVWLLASALTLARCFSVLPEARGLVTRGPYRYVRHPVYLGELGICAGFVLAAPTAWNLAMAVLFTTGQSVRMRLEERALTAAFPLEYPRYAQRTPRLLARPRGHAAKRRSAPAATAP